MNNTKKGAPAPASELVQEWSAPLQRYGAGCFAIFLASGLAACIYTAGDQKIMTVAEKQAAPASRAGETQPSAPIKQVATSDALIVQELSAREESGQTILFLRFSQPVREFRHFPLPRPSRVVLDLLGNIKAVPQKETFRADTNWVATVRLNVEENSLRLVADIAAAKIPEYSVTPAEGGLRIVIGEYNEKAVAKKSIVLMRNGKRADLAVADAESTLRSEAAGKAATLEQPTTAEKTYTGQKITLEFKDADIKNVFRLLGEVSGKNIVITDDVSRKVTLRLVEVPWDQAMDLLISTNGLDREEIGNVIRVSTAARLKADRDALLASKKAGESAEELQTAYLTVNYARVQKGKDDKDSSDKDLVDKVKAVLSPRGTVIADQRTNTLIVRDIKRGIEGAQNIIAKLDVRTPQVLIESNLIETTPTFSRSLGIEMEALFNDGRMRASTRFPAGAPFEGVPQPPPATNLLIIPTTGFRLGYFGNNLTSVLSAAEAEGNVKIISRPSVVTLNNVESQIESANIIRVRTQAATVGESGSIVQVRAGIILTVLPQVSADGFVLMRIAVKSSTLDFNRTVDGIPQENTREAKANVLVRDGETVVIGGIMKDDSTNSSSGVPYLKDIPVLGWLFRKTSWQKDLQELVVFITPRIIEAGSENLPTAEQLWRDQLKQTQGN